MAHYLVTGAAGFIASGVIDLLVGEGHTVVGIDNLDKAYDVRLKQYRLALLNKHDGFSFHRSDICDLESIERIWNLSGPFDAIFNLAAQVGVRRSTEDPWTYLKTNTMGTLNMLELCRRFNTRKFVFSSSSSLYGSHNALPYGEVADISKPLSPYSASKLAAEALCYVYHHLHDLDVTVLRYFTVFGPAGRPDMSIFRFIQWINEGRCVTVYGDGSASRDLTYVDDVARGTIAAAKPVGYEVINLASARPVTVAETIALIETLVGKPARIDYQPRHPADVTSTWANVDKARHLLGWIAQVPHETGIQRCVDWYAENRPWASQITTD